MATAEQIMSYLKTQPEMDPDLHDATYQLMREVVKLYQLVDPKLLDVKDLELVYFTTIGTFKQGYSIRERRIRDSHLGDESKVALMSFLKELRKKAGLGGVQH